MLLLSRVCAMRATHLTSIFLDDKKARVFLLYIKTIQLYCLLFLHSGMKTDTITNNTLKTLSLIQLDRHTHSHAHTSSHSHSQIKCLLFYMQTKKKHKKQNQKKSQNIMNLKKKYIICWSRTSRLYYILLIVSFLCC